MDSEIIYNREEKIDALESSLWDAKTNNRKMRLHCLLAKFYLSIHNEDEYRDHSGRILYHYSQASDLLEYIGENGLMGFRDFYRYLRKLDYPEFFVYAKMDWMAP
ncbi:MAG: hypothetical protein KAJ19_30260 [Gammaproteobacteria bacterium]|nr:hypothetical protein [Gammaproteobacteria bacterium]